MTDITPGTIIRITGGRPEFIGCLATVDEAKSWGVQAGIVIPGKGTAWIRVPNGHFKAICAPKEES